MPIVLELTRPLVRLEPVTLPVGLTLRAFNEPKDVTDWLSLRQRAFADERPIPRSWTHADFKREILDKPWWQPHHAWLAYDDGTLVGSAMLAQRAGRDANAAVLHWLMVDPDYRRQGLGRALLTTVENLAFSLGNITLAIETHAGWRHSVALYTKHGYTRRD